MSKNLTVGSLFSGVGGICLGFQQAGFELAWANEIDEHSCATYRENFNHNLIEGDINEVELPKEKIDVLTAGFPCQPFSIAGERKGFNDVRGNIFWSIINYIKSLEYFPRVLFLENVKNIKSHDNGNTFRTIKEEIEKLGYIIKEEIINTSEFSDLPQNRERVYIVCFLNKEDADNFKMFDNLDAFKVIKTEESNRKKIEELIDFKNEVDDKYYYTKERYPHYFLENGVNIDKDIQEMYQFYQLRRGLYVRKNMSGVCPTLTANMGTGGHNVPLIRTEKGIRKLTPKETFKLQGFPIDKGYNLPSIFKGRSYPDGKLYKQSGNSVSVPIIKKIATEILVSLK